MKSEHRHELKSNELADWLSNLPQWGKDNLGTIIIVVAAIVVIAGFFGWKSFSKNVQSSEHEEFTAMVDDIAYQKAQIVKQQRARQSSDISYILFNKATDLERFAAGAENKNIAALSLVKAADSIRSELQYRPETISEKDLVERMNKAKKDYTDAIAKNPSDKTIKGLAEFGLGLCAEELGNFDDAKKIYNSILESADYEGTIIVSKARLRLDIMDEYKQDVVFLQAPPKPIPEPNAVLDPFIQQLRDASNKFEDANSSLKVDSSDVNASGSVIDSVIPIETNLPAGINIPGDNNNLE